MENSPSNAKDRNKSQTLFILSELQFFKVHLHAFFVISLTGGQCRSRYLSVINEKAFFSADIKVTAAEL